MAESVTGLQGHHVIPQQIADHFEAVFSKYLPGWDKHGAYNLAPRAVNAQIAAQLNVGLHTGSHVWLNDALTVLLNRLEFVGASKANKTKMLSGLVNVLLEAENPAGAKTNGFFAVTHKSDPHFLDTVGTKLDTSTLKERFLGELTWAKVQDMPAYQEVANLNPTVVEIDGKKTVKYDSNRMVGKALSFLLSHAIKPNSGAVNWLLDVIAPDRKAPGQMIANFRQVVKEGDLRIHPQVAELVDEDMRGKMMNTGKGAAV